MSEYGSQPKDSVLWKLVNLEPAVWRGIVVAVLAVLAAVGIKVAPGVPDLAFLVVLAVLPVFQGLWTKSAVTPNAKVAVVVPDPVEAPSIVRAGEAVVPVRTPRDTIVEAATSRGVA